MTNEEAIAVLKAMKQIIAVHSPFAEKDNEAIDMAISALQAESKDCWNCDKVNLAYKSGKADADNGRTDCTDFLCWLLEEIMDEENWEINADADGEIIARKLKKLGLLDSKDGYYVRTPMYEALTEPKDRLVKVRDDGTLFVKVLDVSKVERVIIGDDSTVFRHDFPKPFSNNITESPNEVVEKNDEVIEHDREWIIGCIKHDGFIKTDRFDKANQIILEALEPTEPSDLISRAEAVKAIKGHDERTKTDTLDDTDIGYSAGLDMAIEIINKMPSVSANPTTHERKETKSTLLTLKHLFEDEQILKALDVAIECVSAERVVRCKDCEYKQYDSPNIICRKHNLHCYEDDFCSWAKMKGGTE